MRVLKNAVGGGKHFGGVCLKMCGLLRNILISPQRTLPNKTINNCFERDKKKFLCELNELRNFRGEHNLKRRKKDAFHNTSFFFILYD